jgi:hypothetical protein
LIDREPYLPQSWVDDRDRCRAAGIPDDVQFATKPRLAQKMLQRAIDAGVPFAWFTADEAFGQVKYLRVWLEERDVFHVLVTKCSDTLITADAGEQRADAVIAALPARAWRRLSAGAGAHGHATTTGPGCRCGSPGGAAAVTGCSRAGFHLPGDLLLAGPQLIPRPPVPARSHRADRLSDLADQLISQLPRPAVTGQPRLRRRGHIPAGAPAQPSTR